MDVLAQPWIDLKTGINAVWPEVNAIWRIHQIQKRDWYNLIVDDKMGAPWVVVHLPAAVENDAYGTVNVVYDIRPGVFYITNDSGGPIDSVLEAKAALLQDWILTHNTLSFQVIDSLEIDAGDTNPVNEGFRESVMPYSAVSLCFHAITGYQP